MYFRSGTYGPKIGCSRISNVRPEFVEFDAPGTSLFRMCVRACLENDVDEDLLDDFSVVAPLDGVGLARRSVTFSL